MKYSYFRRTFEIATLIATLLGWNSANSQGATKPTSTNAPSPAPSAWAHEYLRGDVTVPCPDDAEVNCIWHRLVVDNQSADTLECLGRLKYDGVNRALQASAESKMVVVPNARRAVLSDPTIPDAKVADHTVECAIRRPPDASKLTPNCKPLIQYMPSSAEYPAASLRAGEEGPVLVEFSLSSKAGAPTDIVVVGSSLWPRLDEAGIQYVAQFTGYTDCKQGRFRVPVSFRIN